jgi:hypothetical protein
MRSPTSVFSGAFRPLVRSKTVRYGLLASLPILLAAREDAASFAERPARVAASWLALARERRLLRGGLGRRYDLDLLHQAELVPKRPGLKDLAVLELARDDTADVGLPAGGGYVTTS